MHERRYFYKYVSANTAKIILSTRTLRWSSPVLFNDPFDVTQELRLNFDASELNLVLTELIASLIEKGDPGPRWNPWGGYGSFGDDPADQAWISSGSQYYDAYTGQ